MKTLLHSLFVVLLFTSCKKEVFEQTTIQGKVLTKGTDEVIRHPPVRVVIYLQEYTTTFGSGANYTVVAEAMSNEDGSFSLNAALGDESTYFLGVDESTVKESLHYIAPTYGSQDAESRKIHGRGGTISLNYYLSAKRLGKVSFVY